MEGAATTVYAQGGRGNARLIAWEGERTVTFTMEDALISPMGFSVLTGAGLIDAQDQSLIVHKTEQVKVKAVTPATGTPTKVTVELTEEPYTGKVGKKYSSAAEQTYNSTETYYTLKNGEYKVARGITNATIFGEQKANLYIGSGYEIDDKEDYIYVMLLDDNGEISSEPYIASEKQIEKSNGKWVITIDSTEITGNSPTGSDLNKTRQNDLSNFNANSIVLVDYYVKRDSGAFEIDITPDKFGGNFYLEASTLFRATNGVDMPAEFIIPNCKIQSNFTFTMASSGDPSTFTFTMDAFPDYTRWNKTKKVFAAIQVIEESDTLVELERLGTPHDNDNIVNTYNSDQKPSIEID